MESIKNSNGWSVKPFSSSYSSSFSSSASISLSLSFSLRFSLLIDAVRYIHLCHVLSFRLSYFSSAWISVGGETRARCVPFSLLLFLSSFFLNVTNDYCCYGRERTAIEFHSHNGREKWIESVELYYYRGVWLPASIVACDSNPSPAWGETFIA